MTLRSWLAIVAGLGLTALLLMRIGLSSVGDAIVAAGWAGILAATALHVLAQGICAAAWWTLWPSDPGAGRPTYPRMVAIRMLRDSMGEVLPTVPLGELAAIRELMRTGLSAVEASAVTIADVTTELAGQVGFSVITFALVALPDLRAWRYLGVSGLAGTVFIFAGCLWVQYSGGRQLARLCGGAVPLLREIPQVWDRLSAELRRVYGRQGRIAIAAAIQLAAWFVGGLQSWTVLRIMGTPVPLTGALALEAFMFSVHRVAPTPGAVGVQEGGYVLAGSALGIDDGTALALSLVKRARDLLVAVPVILVWQAVRARRTRRTAISGVQF